MAKGNMLMNLTTGKLGSMVFFRAGGEQRVRTYVKTVANPKTASQMSQRVQLSNLVALYRVLKPVLVGAFETKAVRQSDYNAFVGKNLGKVQIYLPKEAAGFKTSVVAPYQVTDGSLPAIQITGIGEQSVTNIALGADFVVDGATTIGALSTAILNNNPSLLLGMQLSYLSVVQRNDPYSGFPVCAAQYYKMILDTQSTALLSSAMPVQAIANLGGFLGHGVHVADGAFCWILSQKDAMGKLTVSPQRLIVTSEDLYTEYSSEYAMNMAGISYGQTNDPFLTPAGTAAPVVAAPQSVSSVKIGDTMIIEGYHNPISAAIGAEMQINGTTLDEHEMSIYVSSSTVKQPSATVISSAVALGTFLANSTVAAYQASGTLANAIDGINQLAIVANGKVIYHVMSDYVEAPDPTA